MNTLNISQIFSNLSFYKENYLSILNDAERYYTEVENAQIQIWPLGTHQLYLGDLLQLWFGDKWLIEKNENVLINSILSKKSKSQSDQDLYVYAINGSTVSGLDQSKAWSIEENGSVDLSVKRIFQFYCVFKSLSRPTQNKAQAVKVAV